MNSRVKKLKEIKIIGLILILFSGSSFVQTERQDESLKSYINRKYQTKEQGKEFIQLSQEHINAVNRRRRIVLQYDAFFDLGTDFNKWINGLFKSLDQPGSQIDALWWDIEGANMAPYPGRIGDRYEHPGLRKWWDQGIDWIEELVKESRKRKLEVFWNHRIAEVDREENPLKKLHPEWLVNSWYYPGLWNLAVPEVRQNKVEFIQELLEKYELDGIQLDFARHVPCLPLGQQWELRENVTEFVRMVRLMMLEMEKKLGRPLLLAAKVPENPEGCHIDGFDVEVWARQNLIDIFTLGTRTIDVDIDSYRQITAGRNIKLQPCWDDHHSTDAYRSPPLETYRGIFGNWWQQGADGVMIFNWIVPEDVEYNRDIQKSILLKHSATALKGPDPGLVWQRDYKVSLLAIAREGGSPETLYLKDKIFFIERRGGYPWSEGYFGRNEKSPLPVIISNDGRPDIFGIRICDNLRVDHDKINNVFLRAVIWGAKEGDKIGARLNGVVLTKITEDYKWKDNLILFPNPQENSGSGMLPDRPVDPKQKLLRLEFNVDPKVCYTGKNQAEIYIISRAPYGHGSILQNIFLEKLELHVDYNESGK
jgi:hypothetical protein